MIADSREYRVRLTDDQRRHRAAEAIRRAPLPDSGQTWEVAVHPYEDTRSLDQNSKMWACIADVAKQVEWHGKRMSKDDWKQVFVCALKGQQAVPGIDGGFVVLGGSSSRLKKREFSDLIEIIYAFGAEHDVVWSERANDVFDEYREVAA
jgi:hypothetical protein